MQHYSTKDKGNLLIDTSDCKIVLLNSVIYTELNT